MNIPHCLRQTIAADVRKAKAAYAQRRQVEAKEERMAKLLTEQPK